MTKHNNSTPPIDDGFNHDHVTQFESMKLEDVTFELLEKVA